MFLFGNSEQRLSFGNRSDVTGKQKPASSYSVPWPTVLEVLEEQTRLLSTGCLSARHLENSVIANVLSDTWQEQKFMLSHRDVRVAPYCSIT